MNNIVTPKYLMILKMDIPTNFNPTKIRQEFVIDYNFIVAPSASDTTYLYLEITHDITTEEGDDFSMNSKIVWCFEIKPIYKATAEIIFECTEFTRNHLTSIMNGIYSHQKNKIKVPPVSFDVERPEILKKLNPVQGHN